LFEQLFEQWQLLFNELQTVSHHKAKGKNNTPIPMVLRYNLEKFD